VHRATGFWQFPKAEGLYSIATSCGGGYLFFQPFLPILLTKLPEIRCKKDEHPIWGGLLGVVDQCGSLSRTLEGWGHELGESPNLFREWFPDFLPVNKLELGGGIG
jgi:hypothetical protein